METRRTRQTCPVMTSPTGTRHCSILLLTILVIILHVISLLCNTWYVLYLDIDGCHSCGTLIVSIATIFEKNNIFYNELADDSVFIQFDELNHKHANTNVVIDEFRESLIERQSEEFVIETGLFIYVGLWTVSVCLVDGRTCTDIDLSTSSIIMRNVQPIADMFESVYDCRPFLVLAVVTHVIMLCYGRLRPSVTTSGDVRTTAAIGAVSAVFSLMAVVIAGMPYLTSTGFFHVVTPMFPWALLSTVLASYLSFLAAFHTWHSQVNSAVTSFRSWQARQLYKYYI